MKGSFRTFEFRRLGFRRWGGRTPLAPRPVTGYGVIALLAGDDYLEAEGRQLLFVDASKTWPSLTGGTVRLVATRSFGGPSLSASGTVKSATEVEVGLPNAQTGALLTGEYLFDLVATLASGHVISLYRGPLTVAQQTSGGFPICQR